LSCPARRDLEENQKEEKITFGHRERIGESQTVLVSTKFDKVFFKGRA
jgi:hypothetical protein